MIVSHEHRFIFIKTHKTAGTSVEVALSRVAGEDAIVPPTTPAEPGHRPRNHEARLQHTLTGMLNNPAGLRSSAEIAARRLSTGTPIPWGRDFHNHMPGWIV